MEKHNRFEITTDIGATQLEVTDAALRFYNGNHVFVR